MNPHRPLLVGFGELVWDVLPAGAVPGGAPANFAYHASQLGGSGVIVSAVGDDAPGLGLQHWLEQIGLGTEFLQINAQPTGRVDVQVNDQGEPGYVISTDAAWDHVAWTDSLATLSRQADCVCFGSLAQRSSVTRATLHRFLRSTQRGCIRLFDVNVRLPPPTADVVRESVNLATVLKLNESEWPIVAQALGIDGNPIVGISELLRKTPIQLVAMTRGARGSTLRTNHQHVELPAHPVDVKDTVGAGDAFAAALAVGLLQGKPLREIQITAARVSEFVCTQAGGTPALPETLKSLANLPVGLVHRWSHGRHAGVSSARPEREPA